MLISLQNFVSRHFSSAALLCFRRKKFCYHDTTESGSVEGSESVHFYHLEAEVISLLSSTYAFAFSDVTRPPSLIQHRPDWFRGSWGARGLAHHPRSKPPLCSSAAVLAPLFGPASFVRTL